MCFSKAYVFGRSVPPRRNSTSPSGTFLLKVLLLSLLFFLCAHSAPAQDEPPIQSDEVVRVRTDLVVVPVFVTDSRGRRVPGLRVQDFELRDDGRRVEPEFFAAGTERVALLFLLDASGSTRDIIRQQRETALALFSRFGARSRVSVMQFRERPEQTLAFTNDPVIARQAFDIASLPDRRTAIFDAALAAVRAFNTPTRDAAFNAPTQDAAERRIVVLISDGLDTASETRPERVVAAAQAAGVSFYVIHLPLFEPRDGRLAARRPSKGFRELAEKTGGQFFAVGDASSSLDPHAEQDLSPIFKAIADDLQGQYIIAYHAAGARQSGFHRIAVSLKTQARRLRVRQLREGYEGKGDER